MRTHILSTLKLPMVSYHHNIQNESKQNGIPGPSASRIALQGCTTTPGLCRGGDPTQVMIPDRQTHNQPQPTFLSRVSLCNPGQPRTCYIDFMVGLEPLKACLPPPLISPSTGEFYINLKGNRFLFAYFIVYSITVSILIAITYPLCREYCDLYALLCGNQLQTNLVIIMQKYNFKT